MKENKVGFTLVELLVVVLIIGILASVALPQYQKAVLKSRYNALMPIAKSVANGNETYYLEHGTYATSPANLDVAGQDEYPDGTEVDMSTGDYSFVIAGRGETFPMNYIVYQNHSLKFAGNIHCEADKNNTMAQEVCQSLGGQYIDGSQTAGYLTYVLSGTVRDGDTFPAGNEGEDSNSGTDDTNSQSSPTTKTCSEEQPPQFTYAPKLVVPYCDENTGSWKYESVRREPSCLSSGNFNCAGVTITADEGRCQYSSRGGEMGCLGATFEGEYSQCDGTSGTQFCAYTSYEGKGSHCYGTTENACNGATFGPNTNCRAFAPNACSNTVYTSDGTTRGCCYSTQGFCPVGSPKCGGSLGLPNKKFAFLPWNGKCWGEGGTEIDCED